MLEATALAVAAAAIGSAAIRTEAGRGLDRRVFEAWNRGSGPVADRAFLGVTELGSLYAVGTAAAVVAALGRPREASRAMGAAGVTWILAQAAKKAVNRRRPYDADPEGTRFLIAAPAGTSWPSSHPAILTAFTTVAARELGIGMVGRVGLAGLGATVAVSRVYVGVHYPSDVASGLLMGRAVAALWRRA